jgi:hypothetical protein
LGVSAEVSSKRPLKQPKKHLTLVHFWSLTHPPTTGVIGLFCWPLALFPKAGSRLSSLGRELPFSTRPFLY